MMRQMAAVCLTGFSLPRGRNLASHGFVRSGKTKSFSCILAWSIVHPKYGHLGLSCPIVPPQCSWRGRARESLRPGKRERARTRRREASQRLRERKMKRTNEYWNGAQMSAHQSLSDSMKALAAEREAIRLEREGGLGALGDRRVGSELAATLIKQPVLGSLGLNFCASLVKVSKTVLLSPGSSWHGKPSDAAKRGVSKGTLYIIGSGSAICRCPGTSAASGKKLQPGDLFGATRFLLQRAPELSCLCPLLLHWWDASAVEAVTECSLVAFSLSDEDEMRLSWALTERLKSYCQLLHKAISTCAPLANISKGERQWLLNMAQLVSVRANQSKHEGGEDDAAAEAVYELSTADICYGTIEPQLLILCSSAAEASHLSLRPGTQRLSVARMQQLYPIDSSETSLPGAGVYMTSQQRLSMNDSLNESIEHLTHGLDEVKQLQKQRQQLLQAVTISSVAHSVSSSCPTPSGPASEDEAARGHASRPAQDRRGPHQSLLPSASLFDPGPYLGP